MSIWCDVEIRANGTPEQLARLMRVEKEDIRSNIIHLSFGADHGPGIRVDKFVEANSGIVFLINTRYDTDPDGRFIELRRYDAETSQHQAVLVEDRYDGHSKVNEKLFDIFREKYPDWAQRFLENDPTTNKEWWNDVCFWNLAKATDILNNFEDYKKMVCVVTEEDL